MGFKEERIKLSIMNNYNGISDHKKALRQDVVRMFCVFVKLRFASYVYLSVLSRVCYTPGFSSQTSLI